MKSSDDWMKLGEIFISMGKIGPEELKEGLEYQDSKEKKIRIGEALIELGFIDTDDLADALASQFKLMFVALDKLPSKDLAGLMPEELARAYNIIPVSKKELIDIKGEAEIHIVVATADPTDNVTRKALENMLNLSVEYAVSSKDRIEKAINQVYSKQKTEDKKPVLPLIVDMTKEKKLADYPREEILASSYTVFCFLSTDEVINQVYEVFREIFYSLPVDDMKKINFDAALNEAVGNAQRHGNKNDPSKKIEITYKREREQISISVKDEGQGFDHKSEMERKKQASEDVGEARARYKSGGYGGLGIMLMNKCVDQVSFNETGNAVTLSCNVEAQVESEKAKREEQLVLQDHNVIEVLEQTSEPICNLKEKEDTTTEAPLELERADAPTRIEERPVESLQLQDRFDDTREEIKPKDKKKPSEEKAAGHTRRATVRYFQRMNPQRNFPLLAIISEDVVQKIVATGVAQVEGKEKIEVTSKYPFVDVIPIFPGCMCTPPKIQLDVTPKLSQAKFWITPNAEGELKEARVEFWYMGRLASVVETPTTVVKQTVAKLVLALSIITPFIAMVLDILKIDVKEKLPILISLIQRVINGLGGFSNLGLIMAFILLIAGIIFYFIKRPYEGNPVEAVFSLKPTSQP